jgi:hypothetical protein
MEHQKRNLVNHGKTITPVEYRKISSNLSYDFVFSSLSNVCYGGLVLILNRNITYYREKI